MTKELGTKLPKSGEKIALHRAKDGTSALEVRLKGETLWLNLNQIAALFSRDKSAISRHLGNIFRTKELDRRSVVAVFATTLPRARFAPITSRWSLTRSGLPNRWKGYGREVLRKGDDLLPGIEDDSSHELLPGAFCKSPKTSEIRRRGGGGGLHFQSDNLPRLILQDQIHFGPRKGPKVIELNRDF